MPLSVEPKVAQASSSRTAVLLVNLGTPASPQPRDVRRFLREFLSDPRVVEIPRVLWLPILYGVVLTVRPRRTAAKYATIWTDQGSPLLAISRQQAILLRGYLGARKIDVDVVLAMRYGEPSIADAVGELDQANVERVLLLPMYPQYTASTAASVFDAVSDRLKTMRRVPELRWVRDFHDQPGYIDALKRSVVDHWSRFSAFDKSEKLVMSFHGVPKRTVQRGDPYYDQCQRTGKLLAESLRLSERDYIVTFQSRFGRAEWVQPYTVPTLQNLAAQGTKKITVICPGFPADCLETLEEIAIESKREFLTAGGEEFHYIPCLNGSHSFIAALTDIAQHHLQGWPVQKIKDVQGVGTQGRPITGAPAPL